METLLTDTRERKKLQLSK